MTYPYAPAEGQTDTSREAAEVMAPLTARVQRAAYFAICEAGSRGLTAHELADLLGMERTTVQPRISELRRQGRVIDSGERRHNANRKRAIVWRAASISRSAVIEGLSQAVGEAA